MLQEKIKELAEIYKKEFIDIRRYLHGHPELSYEEYNTSAFIQKKLTELGIPFEIKATTGVVATLSGEDAATRLVALRADMDALPIQEENKTDYISQNIGVMHACGHDVHTTCLLGAAKILNELKTYWKGTIRLIFQPGEEKNPGGASLLIKEGVLENPRPQAIAALHVNPLLDVGKFSFRSGRAMASADELFFTIKGPGGHAAAPQYTQDVILIAAELVVSLQQIISRNCDPLSPSILSICSFQGGHTTNVIPTEVHLKGTFRAMDEGWRFKAHELIKKHATNLVNALGAEVDVKIDIGYPFVDNDHNLYQLARGLAEEYIGNDQVEETEIRMGSEDFGYYTQQIPGCFFRLGTRNESRGLIHNVHTPRFDVDEDCIPLGMGMMAWLGANLH